MALYTDTAGPKAATSVERDPRPPRVTIALLIEEGTKELTKQLPKDNAWRRPVQMVKVNLSGAQIVDLPRGTVEE